MTSHAPACTSNEYGLRKLDPARRGDNRQRLPHRGIEVGRHSLGRMIPAELPILVCHTDVGAPRDWSIIPPIDSPGRGPPGQAETFRLIDRSFGLRSAKNG